MTNSLELVEKKQSELNEFLQEYILLQNQLKEVIIELNNNIQPTNTQYLFNLSVNTTLIEQLKNIDNSINLSEFEKYHQYLQTHNEEYYEVSHRRITAFINNLITASQCFLIMTGISIMLSLIFFVLGCTVLKTVSLGIVGVHLVTCIVTLVIVAILKQLTYENQ